jgi:hypothetical protein
MRTKSQVWIGSLWIFISSAIAVAGETGPPAHTRATRITYPIRFTEVEIDVDGKLEESAWRDAEPIPVNLEWFPGENIEAPVKTTAYVLFDNNNIYVGFRCEDPDPKQIRAHLMDRDQIFTFVKDDHVQIQFDTFNDQRRGFQFRINPLGVQADAIFSEVGGTEDFSWDMIWYSGGSITDFGYTVEVAFPLKQLSFPPGKDVQIWGIDLGRSYPRNVRHRISNVGRDRNDSCLICQWNKISGLENLEPGRNLELNPTLTGSRTDEIDQFPDGALQKGDEDAEFGLTARWGVTPNMTLLGTINPDFSQVEADAARLDVNTRFALFFEEKRPFFLAGVDLFETPFDAVFTRTVVDPDWGGKLIGKIKQNAVGLFGAEDAVNSLLFPSSQSSNSTVLDESVTSGVARYRRDVGESSTLGVLYTGREGDGYHNRVAGVDGFFRVTPRDTIDFQYLYSDTLYPESVATEFDQPTDSFGGDGFLVDYDHDSRNGFWSVKYEDRDPGLRLDSGFLPRVDIRQLQAFGLRKFWGDEGSWYNRWDAGGFAGRTEDHDGEQLDGEIAGFVSLDGPLQSLMELWIKTREERFEGVFYEDLFGANFFGEFQPNGAIQLELFAEFQETIDFANNQPADEIRISPEIEVRIGRHVNLSIDHTFQRLDVEGGELFTANLTEMRLVYQFTVRLFLRAIVQRLDLERDPELYIEPVEERTETLFSQLLLSYKVNPRTVFFAGYTENRLGDQIVGLTQTNRTFFIKLGYAWIL